jgi:hypothetical protein
MKRRFVLVAVLGALAAVLAPIATASANHSELKTNGTAYCFVEGTAKFVPPITAVAKPTEYSFNSEGVGGPGSKCVGEGTATEYNEESPAKEVRKHTGKFTLVHASVTGGHGEIGCLPNSADGAADLKFEGAVATLEVKAEGEATAYVAQSYFNFESAGLGEIKANLNAKKGGGGNEAKGFANFSEPPGGGAKECVKGAETLPFFTEKNGTLTQGSEGISGTVGQKEPLGK